jgi:hypothetical protein
MYNIKKLGNFSQFGKDELKTFLLVLVRAYVGITTLSILKLKYSETLNTLLPDDLTKLPYKNNNVDTSHMSLLTYFLSFESNFPYAINAGIPYLNDPYLLYLGGIVSYVYASVRFCLKLLIQKYPLNKEGGTMNNIVGLLSFYVLPYILFVLAGFLPFIVMVPAIYSTLVQESAISWNNDPIVWLMLFTFILNFMKTEMLEDLTVLKIMPYIANIWWGFIFSFGAIPFTIFWSVVSVSIYVVLFYVLHPFIVVGNGIQTWSQLYNDYKTTFYEYFKSLTILFLFLSISIAYRHLNSSVAFGVNIGIVCIIILLLNVLNIIRDKISKVKMN